MSKWYGRVGYGITDESRPAIHELKIVERTYYGDVTRNVKTNESRASRNDNIELRNEFSIIADAFAYENFGAIRYLTYMGIRWKVEDVEVSHPRLLLSIGSVYNGPIPNSSESSESSTGS